MPVRLIVALVTILVLAACTARSPGESSGDLASVPPSASISPRPVATPHETTAGAFPVLIIELGADAAPIDVVGAFGSIWVANHHSDDVVRLDPQTGAEQARIFVGDLSGPGYFAVTDDAVWVTRQNGRGIARIDPTTNELSPRQSGSLTPCSDTAVALGGVWYFACDTGQMVRIDIVTHDESFVTATDMWNPIAIDGQLYAVGPDGVARLDDGLHWTVVGGCCGHPIGFAGGTLWLADTDQLVRVDLTTGTVGSTVPIYGTALMTSDDQFAWVTHEHGAPVEQVRMADNTVLEPLDIGSVPVGVWHDGSYLWVTDFSASQLWRVDLGEQ
jgi:DNA-binding beta-propeller fold protein YncE